MIMSKNVDEEIGTILSRLAFLEQRLGGEADQDQVATPTGTQLLDVEIQIRRARDAVFPAGYFADTAWELLLELEKGRRSGLRFAVSDLGLQARIPPTTVLRYVDHLVADGYAQRRPDPNDRRRVFVELTDTGISAINKVFADIGERAGDRSEQSLATFREFPGTSVFAL